MLVSSSQSSTQRPLGLSVEELYALDRQYRRLDQQQQQQQFTSYQSSSRQASSNLNRLNSRSLDLISSGPLPTLPSLEIHGHGYNNRPHTPSSSNVFHHSRSNSIDQLRYTNTTVPPPPPPPTVKSNYQTRSTINDPVQHQYQSQYRYRTYGQQHSTTAASSNASSLSNNFMYHISPSPTDTYEMRNSCKLRRQQPVKRESSRRILVRPVVQRRREPSISSSCESLDEARSPLPRELPKLPASPLKQNINEITNDQNDRLERTHSSNESLSDDSDVNLYEMRVPIGKTYDTSDISVQLEGSKILIHCHTIEPTDKRGNYRKHELKTELIVPDTVDDETIISYLTEDGQLIVEGKYHLWAWKEIKQQRRFAEEKDLQSRTSPVLSPPVSTGTPRNDGPKENERLPSSRIEKLDDNRTVIHVGDPSPKLFDSNSVNDMAHRFSTTNPTHTPIWDGQYLISNDNPPLLYYHVRLPANASMDAVRIQHVPQSNILNVFSEDQERSTMNSSRFLMHPMPRICRLPRDYKYDYAHLRVIFLRDNFIRIEVPISN